jgi:uncharacterized phiE125 gp8 family phage protein
VTTTRAQRLTIVRTVEPTGEPILFDGSTVGEVGAKQHLRLDEGTEQVLVESLITAARQYVEQHTRRTLMLSTWRLSLDRFPRGYLNDSVSPAIEGQDIILPYPNLLAVTSIKYDDTDGVEQTMDSAEYRVLSDDNPGRLALAYGKSWPDSIEHGNAVRIVYTAGYSANADLAVQRAAVPQSIKQAILLLMGHWFEHRESVIVGTISTPVQFTVDSLLMPHTCTEMW